MSKSDKTPVADVGEQITDGIDINKWTVAHPSGKNITFSSWDFAGQTVYYNTHQVCENGPYSQSLYKYQIYLY